MGGVSRRKRPPPLNMNRSLGRRAGGKHLKTVNLGDACGPESPLTPQLLEGNKKFDKYMESKIMVWHHNKQRQVTIADQISAENALK